MDHATLLKITRLTPYYQKRQSKKGIVRDGPYWYGFWHEDGKPKRIYLGQKVPQELEILFKTRFKIPGHSKWIWPGRPQKA